jgi:two-component system response regulator FixJ
MSPASHSSPRVVIVVDDDPDVLGSLKFSFEVEGFTVQAHHSAEALLEGDLPSTNACLVLDYKLPGMDGLELLHRLRSRGDALPAILITTPTAETKRRAALAGVSIVEKPLLCATLVDKVRALITPPRYGGV